MYTVCFILIPDGSVVYSLIFEPPFMFQSFVKLCFNYNYFNTGYVCIKKASEYTNCNHFYYITVTY